MNLKPYLAAAVIAAGLGTSLQASAGIAVGGSIGASRVNGSDFDGNDTAFKGFIGGYAPIVGVEAQYIDFGDLGGIRNPSATAWAPALIVGVPVGVVSIYGKVGQAFYTIDNATITGQDIENDKTFYGVGVRGGAETGLGFRVEYERFEIENADVDLVSAGLEFRF